MAKGSHNPKSFDFTDVEQRRSFFELILAHAGNDDRFLVKTELRKGSSLWGISADNVELKRQRFGSIDSMPALAFFDLENPDNIIEISIKIIQKITILQKLEDF